jgi:hypothetical protein
VLNTEIQGLYDQVSDDIWLQVKLQIFNPVDKQVFKQVSLYVNNELNNIDKWHDALNSDSARDQIWDQCKESFV